jgi:hypothetical protein
MRERTKVIMGAVTAVWPQETGPERGLTLATRRVPHSFQQILIKAVEAVSETSSRQTSEASSRQTTLRPLLEPSFETA